MAYERGPLVGRDKVSSRVQTTCCAFLVSELTLALVGVFLLRVGAGPGQHVALLALQVPAAAPALYRLPRHRGDG